MIDQTAMNLRGMNDGEFQQLAFRLLKKLNPQWSDLVHSGAVEGTSKTRKGTPDIWMKKGDDLTSCFEITMDRAKGKILTDLRKSLPLLAGETGPKRQYVAFLSFEPDMKEIQQCETICRESGIEFLLFHGSQIAEMLDKKENHRIRAEFLGIPPAYDIFMSPKQFNEMQRRSKKLQDPYEFVGRSVDIETITQKLLSGVQVILIEGEPGVGKTRLCLEVAARLVQMPQYYDHEIRILPNTAGDVRYGIANELEWSKKYIIITDDANRIRELPELIQVIFHPGRAEGSVIILNTRSYSSHEVVSQVRSAGLATYARIGIRRLTNTDIDSIIAGEPFRIVNQAIRKEIVIKSGGIPRMALIVAALAKTGAKITGVDKPTLYKEYFEEVFTEVANLLDTNKDKILLAHVAALRSINLDDQETSAYLCKSIGFANNLELEEAAARLVEREIVDMLPSKTIRIFNDSISEYMVYRFFFDEKLGLHDFGSLLASLNKGKKRQALENIAALCQSGYKSRRLDKFISQVVCDFNSAVESSNGAVCTEVLEELVFVASSSPDECHSAVRKYLDSIGIENLRPTDGERIVEIEKKALYAGWDRLLPSVFVVLRDIHLSHNESISHLKSKARDVLMSAIRYLPPTQVDEKSSQWFYGPQLIMARTIAGLVGKTRQNEELDLCASLLDKLCLHHFDSSESDYLDDMKIVMWSGPLFLSKHLKEIRRKAFKSLHKIYRMSADDPRRRMNIVKSFQRPFDGILPFGKSPSPKLMSFDTKEILPLAGKMARAEKHLVLRERIAWLLRRMEESLRSNDLKELRRSTETAELKLFQRFNSSFWGWRELRIRDFDKLSEEQRSFYRRYAAGLSEGNLPARLKKLAKLHEDALFEKSKMPGLEGVFFELGKANPGLAEKVVSLIEGRFPSLFPYMQDLLLGIGLTNPEAKERIADEWLKRAEIEQLRLLSATYGWQEEGTEEDRRILDSLLLLGDPQIDRCLVGSLQQFEGLNKKWVSAQLEALSERVAQHTYADLLMRIEPSKTADRFHYHIHESDSETFKRIVMGTVRFERLDNDSMTHHLSKCIEGAMGDAPDFLFEYFEARLKIHRSLVVEEAYSYEVLPFHTLDLSFVKNYGYYKALLNRVLQTIQTDGENVLHYLELLDCIHGRKHVSWSDEEDIVLDDTTLQTYREWICHSDSQYRTILEVCRHGFSTSWFPLLHLLIIHSPEGEPVDDLVNLLIPRAWSGKRSSAIQRRLETIRKLLINDRNSRVKDFLTAAERTLGSAIEADHERESWEDRFR